MLKKLTSLATAFLLLFSLTACSGNTPVQTSAAISEAETQTSKPVESTLETTSERAAKERPETNMILVSGFLSIGAVNLLEANEAGTSLNQYHWTLATAPDEASAKLLSGEADIAAVPTNMAATLYNKSEGKVVIVAVNTLGVTKLMSTDDSIKSLDDLKGKTVYGSGQGSIPEYTFDYVLRQNGLEPGVDVTVEYKPGHEEVSAQMSAGNIEIATIPMPSAAQVAANNQNAHVILDLTDEWNKLGTKALISQGCVVVRRDLIEKQPEVLKNFLTDYESSCKAVHSDLEKTSELCETFGVLKKPIAMKAIPESHQVYIVGQEMKDGLEPFFEVLFKANPKSVGGALPSEDFYYLP
ncbi:ABC transporter substrate-binding protein [Lacrimispora sp.]|uniref:ABC transporter substrate-binding protein n=1 Tax=Lacrimispora sp. TaxID=2719234 RepID=UPI0028A9571F|nr:PhnD/SsuA/transferrin family substrate-binding protein [Lacrimispora sp.]